MDDSSGELPRLFRSSDAPYIPDVEPLEMPPARWTDLEQCSREIHDQLSFDLLLQQERQGGRWGLGDELLLFQREEAVNAIRRTVKTEDGTLFTAVAVLDRYLHAVGSFLEDSPESTGMACIRLANKLEERSLDPDDLLNKVNLDESELAALELHILTSIQFKFYPATIFKFLSFYLVESGCLDEMTRLRKLAVDVLSFHPVLHFWPSTIAAALTAVALSSDRAATTLVEAIVRDEDFPICKEKLKEWMGSDVD